MRADAMRNEELDTFLKDTEAMITRLAALYDQWFMGIERFEPHVARREADKRLDALRKLTPNNTALKFRTQTILSRWTTLREHWGKVARQIEEGTYRRDVLRAKKRAQELAAADQKKKKTEVHEIGVSDALAALDGDALDELLAGFGGAKTPAPTLRGDEGKAAVVAPPPPRARPDGPAPLAPPASRRTDDAAAPVIAAPPPRAPAERPAPPKSKAMDSEPAVTVPQRLPPPPPPAKGPGVAPPRPQAPQPPQAAANVAPPHPAVPVAPARPAPPQRPAAPAPPVQAAPPRPAPPVTPAAAAPSGGGVAEPRMRAIYDQYVQKRIENNERVDNLKFESLAASIKKMVPELEKKHQGKQIDFEVVVKDGKVGLKPVTR